MFVYFIGTLKDTWLDNYTFYILWRSRENIFRHKNYCILCFRQQKFHLKLHNSSSTGSKSLKIHQTIFSSEKASQKKLHRPKKAHTQHVFLPNKNRTLDLPFDMFMSFWRGRSAAHAVISTSDIRAMKKALRGSSLKDFFQFLYSLNWHTLHVIKIHKLKRLMRNLIGFLSKTMAGKKH